MKKSLLKITVARNSGFCFGVKRAYELACSSSGNDRDVFILGKLVHNDDVCEDLKKKKIGEIKSINEAGKGTIIFTAHGIGPNAYEKARRLGLKIVDTTCPKVMKAQRIAKNFSKKGYEVLIFGDRKHKEVKSLVEWSGGKAVVFGSLGEIKKIKPEKSKKYCLISQTTQNVKKFEKIKNYLTREFRANKKQIRTNFVHYDTICDSTDSRQNEIRKLAKANDLIIVIGGRDSANSKRLFQIAKSINSKSRFIQNSAQLKKSWFNDIKSVAICAGASTPDWIIKDVVKKIKQIQPKSACPAGTQDDNRADGRGN